MGSREHKNTSHSAQRIYWLSTDTLDCSAQPCKCCAEKPIPASLPSHPHPLVWKTNNLGQSIFGYGCLCVRGPISGIIGNRPTQYTKTSASGEVKSPVEFYFANLAVTRYVHCVQSQFPITCDAAITLLAPIPTEACNRAPRVGRFNIRRSANSVPDKGLVAAEGEPVFYLTVPAIALLTFKNKQPWLLSFVSNVQHHHLQTGRLHTSLGLMDDRDPRCGGSV